MKETFFQVTGLSECVRILRGFAPTPHLVVDLEDAFGLALAEDVTAQENLPLMHRSCVDGYAVRAKDTFGSTESNPGYLELAFSIAIQNPPSSRLEGGQCAKIATGGCLPDGADAVIMVEHTLEMGPATVEIKKSLSPWENVMLQGEDVARGERVLACGMYLNPARVGLLAALGRSRVSVHRRVVVGILSTGDEIVDVSHAVRPGLVRDVNSHALAAQAHSCGSQVRRYGLVRDDAGILAEKLETALAECDLLLVSGGSSVGGKDHTLEAMREVCHMRILVHGLAMSPGKPTIVGASGSKALIGLPGQVTSAQVVMHVLIMPFIAHLGGRKNAFAPGWKAFPAILSRNIASRQGRTDFVRVSLECRDNGLPQATPVLGKSGLLKTLLQADGLVEIQENSEGLAAGQEVLVRPLA